MLVLLSMPLILDNIFTRIVEFGSLSRVAIIEIIHILFSAMRLIVWGVLYTLFIFAIFNTRDQFFIK